MRNNKSRTIKCLSAAAAATIGMIGSAHHATAASKYWDTINNGTPLDAGTGTWDTGTTALWNTSSTGATTPLTTWTSGDDAFFQTGGINPVNVSGTVAVNQITFFKSVGLPFEDNVTGWLIYRRALASGRGNWAEM